MANTVKFEIEQTDNGFRYRPLTTDPNDSKWEYINAVGVKSVQGVFQENFGERNASTRQRKNPIRYDNLATIIVNFHDINAPELTKRLQDVDNQATWTDNIAGLMQALSDINSWLSAASSSSAITSILTGNTEVPSVVANAASGTAGSTVAGVKSFSISFEGSNGAKDGVVVESGHVANFSATLSNGLGSMAYTVPNVADTFYPNSPRVVIQYIA